MRQQYLLLVVYRQLVNTPVVSGCSGAYELSEAANPGNLLLSVNGVNFDPQSDKMGQARYNLPT
jgi:hypothetical protein